MAKSLNKNLHSAKAAKTDEFYTQLVDIEKERLNAPVLKTGVPERVS